MSELELLIDLHHTTPRQGPGSSEQTRLAFDLTGLDREDTALQIADIGCGCGAQTLDLAEYTRSSITAVDLFPEFLDRLKTSSRQQGLDDRINTQQASMEDLPFSPAQFDLLWSEGAIYIMGFAEGIKRWREYLRPGGWLAVSEISWITPERPAEISRHWESEYPGIDSISAKIRMLEQAGYVPSAHFILPPECWTIQYYQPLEASFTAFLERHPGDSSACEVVEAEKKEIRLYHEYRDYYSYVFYIARKVD